ncbi:MAG TPA: hypothetical protein VGR00_13060, partial [Thermoanaerobaculia bacterium]|nr:hypothetical protein [Thermoanaerobaculia bacterium]
NRLAKLLSRARVRERVERRIEGLKPGVAADEEALAALLPLLTLQPEPAEAWDDWMEMPNDAVGREKRAAARENDRPKEETGIARVGSRLLAKTLSMVPDATRPAFLAAVKAQRSNLLNRTWAPDPSVDVDLDDRLMARDAQLAPGEEARLEKEIARAEYLRQNGRAERAIALWKELRKRIEALPEGPAKMHDLVAAARFDETRQAPPFDLWAELSRRYPWSLGILEDRVEFLYRAGRAADALELLEKAAGAAASGHRENLTERLVRDSLTRNDLPRARRALTSLLSLPVDDSRRIAVAALLCRVSLREDPAFDAVALGKAESAKLPEALRPDLWANLARAARDEEKLKVSTDLFIEALNQRTDRSWLAEASTVALRAGRQDSLLRFFEAQKKRSPRDVRWAVAVRDVKTFLGDLEGAIAAAKDAVLVAPEREDLQRETVELLSRALRFHEAADFLDVWARARRADESVASWRAGLYLRANDGERALAVEREAIDAFRKDAAGARPAADVKREARERT